MSLSGFCVARRGTDADSASAEFIQIYPHGRFSSATDIGCNVVGAALGLMISTRRWSDSAKDREPIDGQEVIR